MRKIYLMDCTLRDGGYINDWRFGEETIKGVCRLLASTGIELMEVGFLKGDVYDRDRTMFPDIPSITPMIAPKSKNMIYAAMLDMSAPVPIERIIDRTEDSVDAIKVIFKKNKIEEAYRYCQRIKEAGYILYVNFVGTDLYTDREFIDGIERFNSLKPFAMSIVDSFGLIKRKQFLRLAYLADNNMDEGIVLGYHAHNNLQLAFGNAEALVEMGLKRDLSIDACVFGMGRGAGNLNLELFAEYMNENHGTDYRVEPMLEIMDRYLQDIYRKRFWGYSLPFYLSASRGCHPNYAIYLEQKDSLTVKSFDELLKSIEPEDRASFSKEKAERYYREYMENYIDDTKALEELGKAFMGKTVVLLAPGRSLNTFADDIKLLSRRGDTVTVAVNFLAEEFEPDYIFSSNMRRYEKIEGRTKAKCITSSNMKECSSTDYVVNFSSYALKDPEIIDNSGLMALRLMMALNPAAVYVAGMDGYTPYPEEDYYDKRLQFRFPEGAVQRNRLIASELSEIRKHLKLEFITPTQYEL